MREADLTGRGSGQVRFIGWQTDLAVKLHVDGLHSDLRASGARDRHQLGFWSALNVRNSVHAYD